MDKCKIIKNITKVEFEIKKDGFWKGSKVCFKEKPKRKEREEIN